MSREKNPHYYKDVSHLQTVDIYRILDLFDVRNAPLQHAIKKMLVAGGRNGGKDVRQDLREAIQSIERALEMLEEDAMAAVFAKGPKKLGRTT